MKKLLLLLLFIGCAAAVFLFDYFVNLPQPVETEVLFLVHKGDSLNKITQSLEEQKLINNKYLFILYSKIKKIYPQVKAGEYLIDKNVSIVQIAEKLKSGKVYLRKITFPEGLTSVEIAGLLQNDEFLAKEDFDTPQEGSILPETYTFIRGDSPKKVLAQAQKSMSEVLEQAWNERAENLPLKSKEELLVLASIVEKETGIGDERRLVASVFTNRLIKGMKLQTDPTVIYALTKGKQELNRALTRKDLSIDSPYNTYKYYGLPPAPICNPGRASLEAAANPETSPYLYFVANGTGGHNFATSLKEHNTNVLSWKKSQK